MDLFDAYGNRLPPLPPELANYYFGHRDPNMFRGRDSYNRFHPDHIGSNHPYNVPFNEPTHFKENAQKLKTTPSVDMETISFVLVNSIEEAWNYKPDDILSSRKFYFMNKKSGEFYCTWYDIDAGNGIPGMVKQKASFENINQPAPLFQNEVVTESREDEVIKAVDSLNGRVDAMFDIFTTCVDEIKELVKSSAKDTADGVDVFRRA